MTLVEMVMSLLISSVLFLAMGSAVMIAGHAVPTNPASYDVAAPTAVAVERLMSELMYARTVTELTGTAVTFTVAPRGTDLIDETIRYAWDGTTGDPLTRQYNSGAVVPILPSIQSLSFTHVTTNKSSTSNLESPEQLFAVNDRTVGPSRDFTLDASNFVGEFVTPSLPVGTVTWRVTRVMLHVKGSGAFTGQNNVQIQTDNAGSPSGTILDSAGMPESTMLTAYAWQTFSFTNASGISPTAGVHVVAAYAANAPSGFVEYINNGSFAGLNYMDTTSNSGVAWTANNNKNLVCYIYGTYTSPTTVTQYNLQSVRATVAVGPTTNPSVTSTTEVLNHPQVTGP